MADSITYDVAIYRCTNTGDTETNLPNNESVGIDYGMKDTSKRGVMVFQWEIPDRQTDVPTPQNRALTKPETGISNVTLTIGIKINEATADDPKVGTLSRWALDFKTVRGKFSAGRFGVRNNKKPWMNFQPDNNAGWKIIDVNTDDVLQYGGLVDCVVTLQFVGDTTELIFAIVAEGG